MKRILAIVMMLALVLPINARVAQADVVPEGPSALQWGQEVPIVERGSATYVAAGSIVAGVAGLSFGALYFIRKRNGR